MERKPENKIELYGLIGKNISYSFSAGYFKEKFSKLKLSDFHYQNFDLENIEQLESVLSNQQNLKGFNVTIPYKEAIIPWLSKIDPEAQKIGAINTVKIENNNLTGYNTDCYGFEESLKPFLKPWHKKALILGTGGASKAVAYVLKKLHIEYSFVSRKQKGSGFSYDDLGPEIIKEFTIIINCTPLGTFPDVSLKPNIPYGAIGQKHLLYDLIYNPEETTFLKLGKKAGASICNGLRMLELQAEKAWEIWRS